MTHPSLVWFRHDLRLQDQPALVAAVARGEPVIPVYIWSPDEDGDWPPGAASRWWLHHSLHQLNEQLEELGSRLIIRQGNALTELLSLIDDTGADAVYWTRRYEPAAIQRDSRVKTELRQRNVLAQSFNGQLLFEPWQIETKQGRPYQVFTAFWKTCLTQRTPDEPEPAPSDFLSPRPWPKSAKLNDLSLRPTIAWDTGFAERWVPGEKAARQELHRFLESPVFDYVTMRDLPALHGTSRLSPHLHFGEISPRTIWHETQRRLRQHSQDPTSAETFLKEVGWREFAHHLLFHFPNTPREPLRSEFANFPWINDNPRLKAWQTGQTGYPIVDAGMRELWTTGWMHNRVRMIVASFLVKDLLIPWQKGAEWFWDTLVDADLASNTLGWQWTAGCGADAAPFFRIFNPVLQSQKFDAEGHYIRRWVPELKNLPTKWIHAPWTASQSVLTAAGVTMDQAYPLPIVDHDEARHCALEAFRRISQKTS